MDGAIAVVVVNNNDADGDLIELFKMTIVTLRFRSGILSVCVSILLASMRPI